MTIRLSSRTTRRLAYAAVPAALLAAGATAPAVANQDHAARARQATTRTFVATDEPGNMTVEDLGAPSPDGPGLGDLVAFTQDLARNGHHAGTAHVSAIGVDARRHLSEATGTLRLHGGTVQVGGLVNRSPRFTLAVTGGTGRYVGARGTMLFDASGEVQRITLHLIRAGR